MGQRGSSVLNCAGWARVLVSGRIISPSSRVLANSHNSCHVPSPRSFELYDDLEISLSVALWFDRETNVSSCASTFLYPRICRVFLVERKKSHRAASSFFYIYILLYWSGFRTSLSHAQITSTAEKVKKTFVGRPMSFLFFIVDSRETARSTGRPVPGSSFRRTLKLTGQIVQREFPIDEQYEERETIWCWRIRHVGFFY